MSLAPQTCRADGCEMSRRRDQIMCRRHWAMVPKPLQDAVYLAYEPSAGFRQSPGWLAAVQTAIASLRPAGSQELPL